MSMSTHVVGIRLPNPRWKQMKAVYDACQAARIEIPAMVERFFQGEEPDPAGVVVDIAGADGCVRPYENATSGQVGFEVDVNGLPEDVTIIRFYNAW